MSFCQNSFFFLWELRLIKQCIHFFDSPGRYKFVEEGMTDILSKKEIIKHATVGIPKGMKNAVSISIAFSLDILIRN